MSLFAIITDVSRILMGVLSVYWFLQLGLLVLIWLCKIVTFTYYRWEQHVIVEVD